MGPIATRTESLFLIFVLVPLIALLILAGIILAVVLIARRSNRRTAAEQPSREIRKSLGEVLKERRTQSGMTQEYVAEALGVSRQAVSKWELGTSEPNTTNLIAIAKLYGTTADELLSAVTKTAEK